MSFTLISGKSITDPMSTPATAADCLPYRCGADSSNMDALQWCSFWGRSGVISCADPSCAPWSSCPAPAMGAPAPPQVQPQLPMLTPQNIVQPLPDVAAAVAPVPVDQDNGGLWCSLNGAIAQNPMLAVLSLAAVAVLLWPKGGR
jgi:hypothetical protein